MAPLAKQLATGGEGLLVQLLAAVAEDEAQFQWLCGQVAGWHGFLDLIERHGLLGALHQPILRQGGAIPTDALARMEQRRIAERLWGSRLEDHLAQMLPLLAGAAIPCVVLKGPILAERLYGDATARVSIDLDLLIDPQHLEPATEVLRGRGYRLPEKASIQYHRCHHHHLSLDHPQGPRIELHFRTFSGFGIAIDSPEFLARARPFRSAHGIECAILAPEDEMLYLAVHAAGHGFTRLGWLMDLKSFVQQHPGLDWGATFERAERLGVARALGVTVQVLRHLLAVRMPIPAASLGSHGDRWQSAWGLRSRLALLADDSPWGSLGFLVFQAFLCDRVGIAVRHVCHHLGRIARRRIQRYCPSLAPEAWAG